MGRLTAKDFDQGLLDLFDLYIHGQFDRREFIDRAGKFAVGGVTAAALVESLAPRYALAEQVAPDDPSIRTGRVTYESPKGTGTIRAYLARPANAAGKLPGIVVIHENRGLNPYIEDVARRLAVVGFVALAPDGLSPLGGYPGNDDEGRTMQRSLDQGKLREDLFAAYDALAARDDVTDKLGVVGFCYGGSIVNAMAVRFPGLTAAVPFYGGAPPSESVARIHASLLLHFAGLDKRVNAGWPGYEAALKAAGKDYTAYVYPGVNHGFHNDTTPRYDEAAATLAWQRTVAFFRAKLS